MKISIGQLSKAHKPSISRYKRHMMKKNPVHFFNHRGESVLTYDFMSKEIDRLSKENAELKRRLRSNIERQKMMQAAEDTQPPVLH